jgi:RecA-family ATPase
MTALDLELSNESDKYERQSRFVKKLAAIARMYDVLILLVAHKRKNNFSKNENDEISGSGDISNLAMITLTYESNDDIQPEQRLLKLSKNRLFGKTNTSGWVMDYDERSKRVYGEKDDPNKEYSWNINSDGFEETTDNPFT